MPEKKVVPISGDCSVDSIREIKREVSERIDAESGVKRSNNGSGDGDTPDEKFVLGCLDSNEQGDGTLFAKLFSGQYLFLHGADQWLRWGGHSWIEDEMTGVFNGCIRCADIYKQVADKITAEISTLGPDDSSVAKKLTARRDAIMRRKSRLESDSGQSKCCKIAARIEGGLGAVSRMMDARPTLLAVKNGVVDLERGTLRPGRPEDYLFRASPVEYHEDADSSFWESVLWEIYENQEVIDFLQRLFGAALFGWSRDNVFPVFYGLHGQNGKDTVLEAVLHVLGDLGVVIVPEMLMETGPRNPAGPSPDIMALKGARMALASETREGDKLENNRVKMLTGGNPLTGRNPHDKRNITFPPTHMLFVATNFKPSAGSDAAIWKRAILIEHPYSFVENPVGPHEKKRDPQMKSRLKNDPAVASGILRWLVDGALAYLDMGGVAPPDVITAATAEYRLEQDMVARFVIDKCAVCAELSGVFPSSERLTLLDAPVDEVRTSAAVLYAAFQEWYDGKNVPTAHTMGRKFKEKFPFKRSNGIMYLGVEVRPSF